MDLYIKLVQQDKLQQRLKVKSQELQLLNVLYALEQMLQVINRKSISLHSFLLGESENSAIGIESRTYIENRLKFLETNINNDAALGQNYKRGAGKPAPRARPSAYNPESDITLQGIPKLNQTFVAGKRKNDEEANVETQAGNYFFGLSFVNI